ncbi:SubName: Full=Uncharacterized protein {ECO:0000313/EMBL:CCA67992.1} [Serendipita indica DSM 11827]|nr:SubName: Full=Uncharacterized protein {ECO:0000313/EMBL:CCA67992.1} [Serendipita indica DSM 11827]
MPVAPVYQDPENTVITSHIVPALFIWSTVGMLCCLPVLPQFWATQIFALRCHIIIVLLHCTQMMINGCVWSGHAQYIPIYTELGAAISILCLGVLRVNYICLFKFLWIRSKPTGSLYIYDKRNYINLIDKLIVGAGAGSIILYGAVGVRSILIFEGIGPITTGAENRVRALLHSIPIHWIPLFSYAGYGGMALVNLWRFRHSNEWIAPSPENRSQPHSLSLAQVLKRGLAISTLLLIVLIRPLFSLWSTLWYLVNDLEAFRTTPSPIVPKNQLVIYGWSQNGLDAYKHIPTNMALPDRQSVLMTANNFIPLPAIHLLIFWGTGKYSRALYNHWFCQLSTLLRLSRLREAINMRSRGRQVAEANTIVPFGGASIPLDNVPSRTAASLSSGVARLPHITAISPFPGGNTLPLPCAPPPAAPPDPIRMQSKRQVPVQPATERYVSVHKHPPPPIANIPIMPTSTSSSGKVHKLPPFQTSIDTKLVANDM